jgi:hypothetical protein
MTPRHVDEERTNGDPSCEMCLCLKGVANLASSADLNFYNEVL